MSVLSHFRLTLGRYDCGTLIKGKVGRAGEYEFNIFEKKGQHHKFMYVSLMNGRFWCYHRYTSFSQTRTRTWDPDKPLHLLFFQLTQCFTSFFGAIIFLFSVLYIIYLCYSSSAVQCHCRKLSDIAIYHFWQPQVQSP